MLAFQAHRNLSLYSKLECNKEEKKEGQVMSPYVRVRESRTARADVGSGNDRVLTNMAHARQPCVRQPKLSYILSSSSCVISETRLNVLV